MEQIILVDKNDNEIGYEEKEKCHKEMKLHRAFSVFVFNSKKELLIQKRDRMKKTWPGFWSNTCCSHPGKGEDCKSAAKRRLKEELGFSCDLKFLFKFEYKAMYDNVWGEHEIDWVFIGQHDGIVKPDKNEIADFKFISIDELKKDIKENPDKYTPWFKICLGRVLEYVEKIR